MVEVFDWKIVIQWSPYWQEQKDVSSIIKSLQPGKYPDPKCTANIIYMIFNNKNLIQSWKKMKFSFLTILGFHPFLWNLFPGFQLLATQFQSKSKQIIDSLPILKGIMQIGQVLSYEKHNTNS